MNRIEATPKKASVDNMMFVFINYCSLKITTA
ncbi:hypothetical protein HCH_03010 [Hahella chejuensis KCTC 2396]|uniref:Uncharacterized protein n=1 Tax=Hahella chejuensis (strain KCTC 2396) TaxID=349521 RepID=Q2SHU6_HAHCH|nr:hypothetical protein HCH_03010 [Hahella chejuensis KCTC 2396]